MKSIAAVVAFLNANPWVYAALTGVLSVLSHAFADKSPRVVAALQAVSLDLPKLWTALTGKAQPPSAPTGGGGGAGPKAGDEIAATMKRSSAAREWGGAIMVSVCLVAASLGLGATACHLSPSQQATVRAVESTVLSAEQMACVIATAELGANEPKGIAEVCSIPQSLITNVVDVLMAQQKGHAMARALLEADAGAGAHK